MELRESLETYKNLSLELIDRIKNEEEFEELFIKRQNIINNLKDLDFDQSEFKEIFESLGILNIEEELQKTINEEKLKIKKKINFIKITREARQKYENAQFKPTFFNKTI